MLACSIWKRSFCLLLYLLFTQTNCYCSTSASTMNLEDIRYYESFLIDFYYNHYGLLIAIIVGFCTSIFLVWFGFAIRRADREAEEEKKEKEKLANKGKHRQSSTAEDSNGDTKQATGQKGRGNKGVKSTTKKITLPSHPLLAAEFKGHTGFISGLDFDVNGKYLATCSSDRTIRLWYTKTLGEKEHKYIRKNIELDHSTHIRFSPDGTAVITTLAVANTIAVYRITKQKAGSFMLTETEVNFSKGSSSDIMSLDIASTGKFIMTCTDTHFTVWTLKGDVLAVVATNQAPNTCAVVSSCGKFIASAGFTSDVKLWEVVFSKSGEFSQVSRAMELTGHRASVLSISFSGDSTRAATVSKDGTWKYWDIDVRYHQNESPKLLQTVTLPVQGSSLISLSPDSHVCAVSVNTSIYLYLTDTGELTETLDNVHRDVISAIRWDPSSRYLVSAGGEDRHVRVWHNTPGLKALVKDLQTRIPKASTESFKTRLEQQLEDTKKQLQSAGVV